MISSVLLGTTLPGQGLIVTLSGSGFNAMSLVALEKTRNSAGFITAIQLSYIVLASNNTAGTIQSVDTGASFTAGNATLCGNIAVVSSTAITCTLSALTTRNVGQKLSLQLFQQGQLSPRVPVDHHSASVLRSPCLLFLCGLATEQDTKLHCHRFRPGCRRAIVG